ncbi:T9SS type B sorting domain-containing protein [Emticicia sp. C21]|uniref:T9SS type B sorting domain-containing protein n=1 Tax=Emticicia sp. C21 TaxID=2302915 RepID=UPI000E347BA5|nr:T9SS type B sorting domain-containing protein [Emticicia sp. C21]RFS17224.1 hypothetical protein D0T08_05445 [Emticicia sp. C21]
MSLLKSISLHLYCKGILFFLLSISFNSLAQGLCDLTNGAEAGGFDAPAYACIGERIDVKDKSGGMDIKYIFGYSGQPASQLPSIPSESGPNSNWEFLESKQFLILQYGTKNGKPMYACKTVVVQKGIDFSYNLCNVGVIPGDTKISGKFSLQIPKQKKEMPGYTIKYNLGAVIDIGVPYTNLPFNSSAQQIEMPITLNVFAIDMNGKKICESKEVISGVQSNPFKPQITKLEVIEPNKAMLTLTGAKSGTKYSLYRAENNRDYAASKTKIDELYAGTILVDLPDSSKSYCFMVERPTSCGDWEETPDVCTILLDTIDNQITKNILNWTNHPDLIFNTILPPSMASRSVTPKLLKETVGESKVSIPLSGSYPPYTDDINCKKNYCYQVSAEIKDSYSSLNYNAISLSLKRCVNQGGIKPPPITDLLTTVDNLLVNVNYSDNSGWFLKRDSCHLFQNINGIYTKIKSVAFQDNFSIASLFPNEQSYCFKIGYTDECGNNSKLSPEICTIFLDFDGTSLFWTSNLPFSPDPIQKYEIEEVSNSPSIISVKNGAEHKEELDLSFQEEKIKYRVRAVDSNLKLSNSNIIEVSPEFRLYIPNAFTPNGDTFNPTLSVFGKKNMISEFKLEIFDRWGRQLIVFHDKDFKWDGTIDNKPVESGIYALKISAHLVNGNTYLLNNNLVILR